MKHAPLLAAIVIVVLTFASYAPAIGAGFIWDDDDYVTQNPLLRDGAGLARIWTTASTPQYYPLVFTSFWFEHHLWGLDPTGYHLVNILLHVANALLVGCVLVRLGVRGAWWVALLFAVHPVHVESVAWITERKNLLSALFYLLAWLAYLRFDRGGQRRYYVLALAAFLAAMASKTVAATLPLALGLGLLWRNGRLARPDLARLLPFLAVAVSWPLVTLRLETSMIEAVRFDFQLAWWQRVEVACRALLFYPWKIVWPHPLIFNYPRWNLSAGGVASLWPVVAVAALLPGLVLLWRRGNRGIVLALAYYAVTISPALGFFDVYPFRYSFVADHFQYLASLGVLILLVQVALVLDAALTTKHVVLRGRPASAVGAVVVLVLCVMTWSQAHAYRDLPTLWRQTIERNPTSWLALNNLGLIFYVEGDYKAALEQFDRAIAAKPSSAESYTARAMAQARLGHDREAREDFDRAVALDPSYPQARLNRGDFLLSRGRLQEAIEDLTLFLESNPDYPPARRSLARAYMEAGMLDQALADYDALVSLAPDFEAYFNRGVARSRAQRFEGAIADFTRALELQRASVDALGNRAFAEIRLGRFETALADLDRGLSLDPDRVRLLAVRGGLHQTMGHPAAACADWREACRLGECGPFEQHCSDGER